MYGTIIKYDLRNNMQSTETVLEAKHLNVFYGSFRALRDINLAIQRQKVTALIGPSGCGKSTFLRCFNRMNDLVAGSQVIGQVIYRGQDIYSPLVDSTEIRARIGMVFQKANPFPKSIFENVAFGLKINGYQGNMAEAVERSLQRAALWDDVKDRLDEGALRLSGGQQQRLCIARALAVEPEIILMDEPASALDPIATLAIEELIRELSNEVTIVIVTHNMQQAARVSDETAFLMMGADRAGYLVEHGITNDIFTNPIDERTEAYITGRFS
jgi:phosphate transport system ATP-binding protein